MSEPQIVAAQSLEHFEKVVDSWMQREPFKSMDRSEARRVIAGIPLLMAQRGPVDPENPRKIELSQTDLEEAKRLCDEAEAQGRHPFGISIPPRRRPMHDQDLDGYKARLEDCKALVQVWLDYAKRLREGTEPWLAKEPEASRMLEAVCNETCARQLKHAIEGN